MSDFLWHIAGFFVVCAIFMSLTLSIFFRKELAEAWADYKQEKSSMELVRDTQPDGKGNKYVTINLTKIEGPCTTVEELIAAIQANPSLVEWGRKGEPDEHFVMKLKDPHSRPGIKAYAHSAEVDDPEYGKACYGVAARAGSNSPFCKKAPD